jgi:hypothetical protein
MMNTTQLWKAFSKPLLSLNIGFAVGLAFLTYINVPLSSAPHMIEVIDRALSAKQGGVFGSEITFLLLVLVVGLLCFSILCLFGISENNAVLDWIFGIITLLIVPTAWLCVLSGARYVFYWNDPPRPLFVFFDLCLALFIVALVVQFGRSRFSFLLILCHYVFWGVYILPTLLHLPLVLPRAFALVFPSSGLTWALLKPRSRLYPAAKMVR